MNMDKKKIRVVVLGATGSVGTSALNVIRADRERFDVVGLSGRTRLAELAALCREFGCSRAVTADPARLEELRRLLPGCTCGAGISGMTELACAPETETLLCAVAGADGLLPVMEALKAGKKVALASKEVLVLAGDLVMPLARPETLLPVDSEHAAVRQCLEGRRPQEIRKIILTASGGPFRTWGKEAILTASPEQALRHPTWNMGRKITVDSASMMNKALELVEAHHLFGVGPEGLGVLIHPQSQIHALVELADGSFIAQAAVPDMRLPTAWALTWPDRGSFDFPAYDWRTAGEMSFFEPDRAKFPSFDFADAALRAGGTLPGVMSAANDVAVERFLAREIPFGGIWRIIEQVMAAHTLSRAGSLDEIMAADAWARAKAREVRS